MTNAVIVSCTTTYDRLEVFYYAHQSFFRQTRIPDKVVLNISHEPYLQDKGIKIIPDWLKESSIEVNFVPNDGPYRKLVPTLQYAGEDDMVVTVDDDVIYSSKWLETLVMEAEKNPDKIIAGSGREIRKNIFGTWQNYRNWKGIEERKSAFWILPTGHGGVLYRKSLLDMEFLLDRDKYRNLAPTTDDVWFRMASMLKGAEVLVVPDNNSANMTLNHKSGLEKINLLRNKGRGKALKEIYKIYSSICNYLGINNSRNDESWENAYKYSKLRYEEKS